MPDIIGWLAQNKTWVFSGIGVLVISLMIGSIGWLLRRRKTTSHQPAQRSGGGSNAQEVRKSKSPPRRQAPTPNISYSSCRLIEVSSGAWPKDGIYEGRGSLPLGIGVALAFQNNPSGLAGTAAAPDVIAQIVFTKSSAATQSHVRYGCWLGNPSCYTTFEIGDTRELLLLLYHGGEIYALDDKRNNVYQFSIEDSFFFMRRIENGMDGATVTLIEQQTGTRKDYVFRFETDMANDPFRIKVQLLK